MAKPNHHLQRMQLNSGTIRAQNHMFFSQNNKAGKNKSFSACFVSRECEKRRLAESEYDCRKMSCFFLPSFFENCVWYSMIWSPGPMRGVCPVNSSLLTPTHLLGWTEAN